MKQRVLSWRTCPKCMGRATKLVHLNTGRITCQQCDHEYDPPERKLRRRKTVVWDPRTAAENR